MEKIIKQNTGIDVSMGTFWATITVLTALYEIKHLQSKEFDNTPKGYEQLMQWMQEANLAITSWRFTMEATGVYYEHLANFLFAQNHTVHVALPNRAKKFAESLDAKSKTDKLDSRSLGIFGIERKLRAWQPAKPVFKAIKGLTRERSSLIQIRTQFKNNLHALTHSFEPNKNSIKRINSLVKSLDNLVANVEKELATVLEREPQVKEKVDRLTTIRGVGQATVLTVLAETDGFSLIENAKQLCSYAGYDVKLRESGKWKGKSTISKKGNSQIRAALYYPALSAIRCSPHYKGIYERIKANNKKSKVGITAVSRKLLVLMYSVWKNGTVYEENHQDHQAA